MLFNYDYIQSIMLIFSYMLIYNVTSFLLFSTIMQVVNTDLKTLYSFANLGTSNVFTKIISLTLLSLAGVPPLLGFFSKVFVFVLISNSNLSLLFLPFFVLLFVGLYFYVQNLRFLNTTSSNSIVYLSENSTRMSFVYFTFMIPTAFLIIFGFCYVDDLFVLALWLLV